MPLRIKSERVFWDNNKMLRHRDHRVKSKELRAGQGNQIEQSLICLEPAFSQRLCASVVNELPFLGLLKQLQVRLSRYPL